MNDDTASKVISNALDSFLLKNPERSSAGVLLGIVLSSFAPAFTPLIQKTMEIDFSSVPIIGWVAFGILLFNMPTLFSGKYKLSPEAENTIALIDEAEKKGMPRAEANQRRRLLILQYTRNLALNKEMETELKHLREQKEEGRS